MKYIMLESSIVHYTIIWYNLLYNCGFGRVLGLSCGIFIRPRGVSVASCDVLGRLGGVLGCLGPSWGRLGGVLGASGSSWGRLGGVLGASWSSWGRLGGVLESKMEPRWIQNEIKRG